MRRQQHNSVNAAQVKRESYGGRYGGKVCTVDAAAVPLGVAHATRPAATGRLGFAAVVLLGLVAAVLAVLLLTTR